MRRITPHFEIEAREEMGTTMVIVSLGNYELGRWCGHTRYVDAALDNAEKAVVKALQPLVEKAMADDDLTPWEEAYPDEIYLYEDSGRARV